MNKKRKKYWKQEEEEEGGDKRPRGKYRIGTERLNDITSEL